MFAGLTLTAESSMNDRLLEILTERPDFNVTGSDRSMLKFFVDYLDHGSLFMVGFDPGDDPEFTFTNDAQRYKFRLSEIRQYATNMKQGIAMDWDVVPFEFISKE